jgi:hypothetical protein
MLQLAVGNLGEYVGNVPGGGTLSAIPPQIASTITMQKQWIKFIWVFLGRTCLQCSKGQFPQAWAHCQDQLSRHRTGMDANGSNENAKKRQPDQNVDLFV